MADLIPRPAEQPVCVYTNGSCKPGLSLQAQMGMANQPAKLRFFLAAIRTACLAHGIELRTLSNHDGRVKDVLKKIKPDVLAHIEDLRRYEDGWPISFYLKLAMKGAALRQRRNESHLSHYPHERNVNHHSSHDHQLKNQEQLGVRSATDHSLAQSTDPGESEDEVVSMISAPEVRSCQSPSANESIYAAMGTSTLPATTGPTTSMSIASTRGRVASNPCSASTPVRRPTASPTVSQSIFQLLLSFSIPHGDAVYLVQLFASFGISDLAHLKIFARMHSRDGWLSELRQKGDISEIQMRVLRELLDQVAKEELSSKRQ